MISPGTVIGRYVVERKLAEGGMAVVYVATARGAEGFSKEVALKLVRDHVASDPGFNQMFIAEARLASRLNHAHVVHIFDFDRFGDSYFIAMEFVVGASLFEVLSRARKNALTVPPILAAKVAAAVAQGLHYAHTLSAQGRPLGLVHRDVTPHNVLISFDGAVKLTDFGIAKVASSATVPGVLKGKFAYMAPEQARGDSVDARTDVFALGVVLWEMLTGQRLFDADSDVGMLRAVQESAIPAPSRLNDRLPAALDDIVARALARPSEARFQTARDFEVALAHYIMDQARSVNDTDLAAFMQSLFPAEHAASLQREALRRASSEHTALATENEGALPDTVVARHRAEPEATSAVPARGTAVQPGIPEGLKAALEPRTDEWSDPKVIATQATSGGAEPLLAPASVTSTKAAGSKSRQARPSWRLRAGAALGILGAAFFWAARAPAPAREVAPAIEAQPAVETGPNVEAPPVVEPLPVEEPAPVVDSLPVAEPLPAVESPPAATRKKAPVMGTLTIEAKPFAVVRIDGIGPDIEVVGVRDFRLPVGRHTVRLSRNKDVRKETVVLEAGASKRLVFLPASAPSP